MAMNGNRLRSRDADASVIGDLKRRIGSDADSAVAAAVGADEGGSCCC